MADEVKPDVGDVEYVKRSKAVKKLDDAQKREIFKKCLQDYGFREIVWDILSECGVYTVSWQGEVNQTLFNEGKRKIGISLLTRVMEADEQAYIKMQREAQQRGKKK